MLCRVAREILRPDLRNAVLAWAILMATFAPVTATAQWAAQVSAEGTVFVAGSAQAEPTVGLRLQRFFPFQRGGFGVGLSARLDPANAGRNRFDIDELAWFDRLGDVDVVVGFREVFWGVLESRQLVDVINQRDPERRWPGAEKLGQPMVGIRWSRTWGDVQFFLLPWARPRPFDGMRGRLWSNAAVAESSRRYTGAVAHVAWATRWSLRAGAWDVGASYFAGTARDPRFELADPEAGAPTVRPIYDRVQQLAIDAQYTGSSWLWKVEAASADPAPGRYVTLGSGIEYQPAAHLSLFAEFLYDGRGDEATTSLEHDVFVGGRLLYQDGRITAGAYVDAVSGNVIGSLELSRRYGDDTEFVLGLRGFFGREEDEPGYALREDGAISLLVRRYF